MDALEKIVSVSRIVTTIINAKVDQHILCAKWGNVLCQSFQQNEDRDAKAWARQRMAQLAVVVSSCIWLTTAPKYRRQTGSGSVSKSTAISGFECKQLTIDCLGVLGSHSRIYFYDSSEGYCWQLTERCNIQGIPPSVWIIDVITYSRLRELLL